MKFSLLRAFANCGKVIISFVMCLSVCLSALKQLGSHWTDFNEIWHLSIFRKSVEKIRFSLKSDKDNGYFTWRQTYIFYHISLSSSWNDRCFGQKLYRRSKHILCSITSFFFKSRHLWNNVQKYCGAGMAADDKMANAHCMLDNLGYKRTHSE